MNNIIKFDHSNNGNIISSNGDRISDSELELIADISQGIGNILDSEILDSAIQDMKTLENLIDELAYEVRLVSIKLGYNYWLDDGDYKIRLSQSNLALRFELDKLFNIYPRLRDLCSEILSFYDEGSTRELMRLKLYTSLFEDIVYESMEFEKSRVSDFNGAKLLFEFDGSERQHIKHNDKLRIESNSIDDMMNTISNSKTLFVDLSYFYIQKKIEINKDNLFNLIQLLATKGVIGINLGGRDYNQFFTLNKSDCVDLLISISRLGIQYLYLDVCQLHRFFADDSIGFTDLIENLGNNGITYINLGFTDFHQIFGNNEEKLIDFAARMANSGIKSLDFCGTNIYKIFQNNPTGFINFIKALGNGIKFIDFLGNDLSKVFANNPELFLDFIKIAGMSGLKFIRIGSAKFDEIFGGNFDSILAFIDTIGYSGLRKIDLRDNFTTFLRTFDKKQIDLVYDKINSLGKKQIKIHI